MKYFINSILYKVGDLHWQISAIIIALSSILLILIPLFKTFIRSIVWLENKFFYVAALFLLNTILIFIKPNLHLLKLSGIIILIVLILIFYIKKTKPTHIRRNQTRPF